MATKAAKKKAKPILKKRVRKAVNKRKELEIVDPRQTAFLTGFLDPQSPTYSNATQSAIAAGFTESYADNILHLMPDWLSGSLGKETTAALARRHIDEVLQIPILVPAMGAFGPIVKKIPTGKFKTVVDKKTKKKERVEIMEEEPVFVYSASLIKEKSNMAKLAVEALDPDFAPKKNGPKVNFNFNMGAVRERYRTDA